MSCDTVQMYEWLKTSSHSGCDIPNMLTERCISLLNTHNYANYINTNKWQMGSPFFWLVLAG